MIASPTRLGILRDQVLRHAVAPCRATAIPRVSLSMLPETRSGMPAGRSPVTCLVLQGAKHIDIGGARMECARSSVFVGSLDKAVTGRMIVDDDKTPFLAVGLALDPSLIADLVSSMPAGAIGRSCVSGSRPRFAVSPSTSDLLDAWGRLLELLDRPDDIQTLAPGREREVLYRLLRGPLGGIVCALTQQDQGLAGVRRAMTWMRGHYSETLRTATLAQLAGMSVASFHRHFKSTTAMTPLQYQRSLRLQAARRLLATGERSSQVGYKVGYGSATHFSRDYQRYFKVSPSRDADLFDG